jgi:hypothetical protein
LHAIYTLTLGRRRPPAASPDYTALFPGSNNAITDSAGNTWSLTVGRQIMVNGVIDPVTNRVNTLLYISGTIWQNTDFGWYHTAAPGQGWTPDATGPVSPDLVPDRAIVPTGSTAAIVDSNGHVWTIGPTAQVVVDGIVDSSTNNVAQIVYTGLVWQQTIFGNWSSKSVPADPWTAWPFGPAAGAPAGMILGAYTGDASADINIARNEYKTFVVAMGEHPMMYLTNSPRDGTDWGDAALWSGAGANLINSQFGGQISILMIGIPMCDTDADPATAFASIAAGGWDSRLKGALDGFKKRGYTTLYLRPGWEMNGDWEPWLANHTTAPAFVTAFQYIANFARSWAGTNQADVQIIWNPGYIWGFVNYLDVYPGDSYVDHIGIDTYGYAGGHAPDTDPYDANPSDPTDFSLTVAIGMSTARGIPLCFPEVGCGPGDVVFQQSLQGKVTDNTAKVSFMCIWNTPEFGLDDLYWGPNADSGKAWKTCVAAIRATNSI